MVDRIPLEIATGDTKRSSFMDRVLLRQPKIRKLMFLDRSGKACSIDYDAPLPKLVEIAHPSECSILRIWGHCNGFLCITGSTGSTMTMLLWNPFTGEHRKVPDAPKYPTPPMYNQVIYLIGYDYSARDYIVVSVVSCDSHSEIQVYSSRSNIWTRMRDIPYTLSIDSIDKPGCFANGSFYWAAQPRLSHKLVIVSYHLDTGEIMEVPIPDYVNGPYCYCIDVLSLDGDLGLLFYYTTHEMGQALWLVKKCDGRESWTQLQLSAVSFTLGDLPLSLVNNGAGLLSCNEYDGFSVYNFERRKTGHLRFQDNRVRKRVLGEFFDPPAEFSNSITYIVNIAPLCS